MPIENRRTSVGFPPAAAARLASTNLHRRRLALLGMIYTVRAGFDLDVGYRGRVNTAAPIRQSLLGITCRGAL
jgi:hypothetical protein